MVAKKKPSEAGSLAEIAEDVARRLIGFESYDRSEAQALAALRKRCPGHDEDEYARAFAIARDAYKAAQIFVKSRERELWDRYKADKSRIPAMAGYADELCAQVPGLDPRRAGSVLAWVFYWHHLR